MREAPTRFTYPSFLPLFSSTLAGFGGTRVTTKELLSVVYVYYRPDGVENLETRFQFQSGFF